MLMYRRTLLIGFVVLIAGCGKHGLAPVHGLVTLDGQPLANADIKFQPDDGPRSAVGRTDSTGHYRLMYMRGEEGAPPGKHTVQISVSPNVVPNAPKIAARFDSKSELRREVKSGGNEFDFDVTTEKK
jgi:hypothetical protein